jgi:hypothetical protein
MKQCTLTDTVDQVFFVVLKAPKKYAIQLVLAARYEVRGEHVAFVNAEGRLAALFQMEIVQSWNVLTLEGSPLV